VEANPHALLVAVSENMCLHLIVKGGTCVCSKEQKSVEINCGTNHQGALLVIQGETHLVQAEGFHRAFLAPSLSVSLLGEVEKQEFLAKMEWMVRTWSQVFGIYIIWQTLYP
jgi:hypothetical protein